MTGRSSARIDPEVIHRYQQLRRDGHSVSVAQRMAGIASWATARRHDPPLVLPASPTLAAPNDPRAKTLEELVREQVERLMRANDPLMPPPPEDPPVQEDPPAPPIDPPWRTSVVRDTVRPERTLFLSDLHVPFHDLVAWRVVMELIEDFRPQLILLGGDLFDCYPISDHDQEPGRADYLQDEFDAAQPLWRELEDRCRGATVVFWKGNHEERIDRMQRRHRALFRLRSLEIPVAAEMPRRWLYYPNQTRYRLGPLNCIHGDLKGRGNSVAHAAAGILKKLRTSAIFGHFHRFQTFYETNADGTVRAGFANGHLSDVAQAKYITDPDWQSGVSTIEFDWSRHLFSVDQHLIIGGATRFRGRTLTGVPAVPAAPPSASPR
jgi:hypothetical protein